MTAPAPRAVNRRRFAASSAAVKVLLTAADTEIGAALLPKLTQGHEVAAAAYAEPLEADAATEQLVAGAEVIVHLAPAHLGVGSRDDELVDYATRRTYNLLHAAADQGVSRMVYVSSLRVMSSYPEHYAVTENWRPNPDPRDGAELATHLGEMVAKEFARDDLLNAVALRVGFPVVIDRQLASARQTEHGGRSSAIAIDELADVVDRSIRAPLRRWCVIHAQSPAEALGAEPRYLMHDAARLLGFPDGPLPPEAPKLPGT